MKPHPRIRKTIKWGGAALTVLLVVVWIGSYWYCSVFVSAQRRRAVCVDCGEIRLVFDRQGFDEPSSPGWHVRGHSFRHNVWIWNEPFQSQFWYAVPLWLPSVAVLALTALAFRLDTLARRRARMNLCPKCHYDRTGLAGDAKCPECGTSPSSPQRGDGL